MNERGEPCAAFDDGADRGPVDADDEVALVVTGYGAVFRLGGPLTDQDIGGDREPTALAWTWPAAFAALVRCVDRG